MKNVKKNDLKTKIAKIKAEAERDIEAEILKAEILEKVRLPEWFGMDNVIVYTHRKELAIGFGIREAINDPEILREIVKAFPIDLDHKYSFKHGDEETQTDSSIYITWCNDDLHYGRKFKINYLSTTGNEISIEVPAIFYEGHTWTRERKVVDRENTRYVNDIYIDNFYSQTWGGGYVKQYFLEGAESLEEYINFVMTGKFSYEDEITRPWIK